MTKHVIEARGLVKEYGRLRALDGLDLTLDAGEVRGFLGLNGAGKSTTIRSLLGQLRLDASEARLFGHDAWSEAMAVHPRIAYVPGDVALWPQLTGGEVLSLLGTVQGQPDVKRRNELVEQFEFDPTKRVPHIRRGTDRRPPSSPLSPPTPTCSSSTSPPPGLIP
jgi:ABC-2 type transport system ATP-binding protein